MCGAVVGIALNRVCLKLETGTATSQFHVHVLDAVLPPWLAVVLYLQHEVFKLVSSESFPTTLKITFPCPLCRS